MLLALWRIANAVVDDSQVAGFAQDADAATVGSVSVDLVIHVDDRRYLTIAGSA